MEEEALGVPGDILQLAVGALEPAQDGVVKQLVVAKRLGHLVLKGLVAGLAKVVLQWSIHDASCYGL